MSSLTTLATMSCQSSLSSVALMSWVGLTVSSKHVHKLSKYISLFVVLLLLSLLLFQLLLVPLCLAFSWHVQRIMYTDVEKSDQRSADFCDLCVYIFFRFSRAWKAEVWSGFCNAWHAVIGPILLLDGRLECWTRLHEVIISEVGRKRARR